MAPRPVERIVGVLVPTVAMLGGVWLAFSSHVSRGFEEFAAFEADESRGLPSSDAELWGEVAVDLLVLTPLLVPAAIALLFAAIGMTRERSRWPRPRITALCVVAVTATAAALAIVSLATAGLLIGDPSVTIWLMLWAIPPSVIACAGLYTIGRMLAPVSATATP